MHISKNYRYLHNITQRFVRILKHPHLFQSALRIKHCAASCSSVPGSHVPAFSLQEVIDSGYY